MKKFIITIVCSLAIYNAFAQDLRVQQGSSPVIKMSAGSTATTADWQIESGAVTNNQATFNHTWTEAEGNYTLHVTPLIGSCNGATKDYVIEVFVTLPPTDPNITAIALSTACYNETSTATLTLNSNFPTGTAYTVSYVIGSGTEQTASVAAGANTFSIDATGLAASSANTVTITKFKISGQAAVALASGPTATLNVNAVPSITGIE